jgi:signal transduction histidine kinase/ligand-binding sensor domain-containing protein
VRNTRWNVFKLYVLPVFIFKAFFKKHNYIKIFITFLLFAYLFLLTAVCPAQEESVLFKQVSLVNVNFGLITGITQDPQGYIWLASYTGLHRYDGYNDTRYSNDPGNPNSLVSNSLECVCSDKNGIIWIGTNIMGLDRFDPETGIFTHYHPRPKDQASLCSDSISAIIEDHDGILWIGTDKGLNRLDPKTGRFTRYVHNDKDSTSLSQDQVRVIYEDHQGILWIGTGSPWSATLPWKELGGLNRFDRKTAKFKRYLHDPKDPHSLIDNRVRAIFEDSRGTFWVGTAGDGLHTMDRTKGIFERHLYDPAHPEKLSRPTLEKTFMDADDHITFITEDVSGAIWIGTFANGINRFDSKTKKIHHYGPGKDSIGGFTDKSGWWAFKSREGVIWISTWQNNLYKIDPYRIIIPHHSTGEPVLTIQEDNTGMLWWGTTRGLFCRNQNKATIKHFVHDPHDPKSLSDDFIQTIYLDDQGKIWVGTQEGGLNLFDPKKQGFTSYRSNVADKNSLSNNAVHALFRAREKTLWIGTQGGLDQMNIERGNFIHYRHDPRDKNSLGVDYVTCIEKDGETGLWVGCSRDAGLQLLNLQTGKFKNYLTGININCICKDSVGVIWVGSDFGLFRFNRSEDQFKPFALLKTSIQTVYINYISEDNQKNLWASTSMGIIRINSKRDAINIYSKNHGVDPDNLRTNGYQVVCGKSHSGELFFADATGYYAFFPDQIKSNPTPPQIVLTGFRLGEKLIKPDANGPLTEPLSQAKEIRLSYDQNIFSFEFTAIHYSNPEDNRQIFMLENSDKDWRDGNGDQTAYFNNIAPGRYVFRIRAFNGDGAWMEKAISIFISPPWWSTWWAYCLYALLAGGIVYTLYRNRIGQIENKQAAQIKAMVATQEDERKRISRDLHDDVGTKLSALKFFLSSLHEKASESNNEEIKSLAQSSEQFITEAMQDVRQLLLNLSPTVLEEFGYTTAVEGLVNKINETKQINFNLVVFGMKQRLQKDYELALYRITQELINNVLKHAEAKNVSLQIGQRDQKIILMMEDDGKGFDVNAHKDGYGLHNLDARTKLMQGTMIIDSKSGKGTSVLIEIPYNFNET